MTPRTDALHDKLAYVGSDAAANVISEYPRAKYDAAMAGCKARMEAYAEMTMHAKQLEKELAASPSTGEEQAVPQPVDGLVERLNKESSDLLGVAMDATRFECEKDIREEKEYKLSCLLSEAAHALSRSVQPKPDTQAGQPKAVPQGANAEPSTEVDRETRKAKQSGDRYPDSVPNERGGSIPAGAAPTSANGEGVEEPEWPTPEYAQHIQFEGRDCVVMAPEEYESLWNAHNSLRSRLAAVEAERDEAQSVCRKHAALYEMERARRKQAESQLAAAESRAFERAAKACEKRAEKRWEEHGFTEPDTNAAYYPGKSGDWHQAQDEEDENCAAAIRALASGEKV